MKIVVLDGHTLNPGDLSWDALCPLGTCEVYARTSATELYQRAAGAEILLTNKHPLTRENFAQLPKLRCVGVTATGYNVVDVAAAREREVVVTNVPAYGTSSVAQMTLALLLELTQHVGLHAESVRAGRWARSADWCYWDRPLVELAGLQMGIVGFGRIGQAVAALVRALGMEVRVATANPAKPPDPSVKFADLDTIFAESDVISLHCPLTPETRQLVNAARLARMKPSAFLINTSRGALIDEVALAAALERGQLAGAALDVLSSEPPPLDHPLVSAKNCLITPHLAWATQAARRRLMAIAVANVRAFLSGKPENVVN